MIISEASIRQLLCSYIILMLSYEETISMQILKFVVVSSWDNYKIQWLNWSHQLKRQFFIWLLTSCHKFGNNFSIAIFLKDAVCIYFFPKSLPLSYAFVPLFNSLHFYHEIQLFRWCFQYRIKLVSYHFFFLEYG